MEDEHKEINEKLATLIAFQECNYRSAEKVKADTEENSKRITIIETRSKTIAGLYIALIAVGGVIMWLIDKIISVFQNNT